MSYAEVSDNFDAQLARALQSTVHEIAEDVRDAAKRRAPVDTNQLRTRIRVNDEDVTGTTAKSVVVSDAFKDGGMNGSGTGKSYTYPEGMTTPSDYAPFQELGWTDRSGKYHPGVHYMAGAAVEVAAKHQ